MTNEQINIAIAEACGWKIDQERKTHGFKPLTDGCHLENGRKHENKH